MMHGRSRWLLRLAILLAAGLAFLLWFRREHAQDLLPIENRSGQPIPLLKVSIAGQTRTFNDLAPGAEVTVSLGAGGDDRCTVEGRLADGTLIRGQFGQISSGLGSKPPRLVILPGGQIALQQGRTSLRKSSSPSSLPWPHSLAHRAPPAQPAP